MFNKTVFIAIKKDSGSTWLQTEKDFKNLDLFNGDKVGIYELKEVKTFDSNPELV